MRKLIKVTKKHIDNGQRENPFSCPVACAIKDGLKNELNLKDDRPVSVASVIEVVTDIDSFNRPVPRSVDRFINRFDSHGSKGVKPFNFYLDI